LQGTSEFSLVEVFGPPNGQNPDRKRRVDEDVVDQLGCDGETVEAENLDISKDIGTSKTGEDAT
jgi:hypothetical protein